MTPTAAESARTPHVALRTAAAAAAFTAGARPSLVRRWSRKTVQATPPPLPLISLPPDDDWEEFDVPVKTGFAYTLPHLALDDEEERDESATPAPIASGHQGTRPLHDRAAICRVLSEYMAQNEAFQVRRHGFGIDSALVYKRSKSSAGAAGACGASAAPASAAPELAFDAFFESGNLDRAYRVLGRHYAATHELLGGGSGAATTPTPPPPTGTSAASSSYSHWLSPFPFFIKANLEYDLYCDTDLSTHGHIQWYFFRVSVPPACFQRTASSSAGATLRVRFNLRNMLKKASLYNDGMLPAVYVEGARGWHHAGANVCYFKNATTYRHRKSGKAANYYTLSFVYEFCQEISDQPVVVYFAHCYPYTYSRLQRHLLTLQKDPARNRFFRRRVLCKTIAGNICDVLTITDFGREDDARPGVVFTARVHPGESNASFLMHGLLDFLTGPSLEARFLRHRFVIKVVPMLNPDGVVHGNYRCSLAGTDLNRRYVGPSPELHPTVFATKNLVLSLARARPVALYCDLHGHSRKRNIFLYGCVPSESHGALARAQAARLRLFPHVLSKTSACFSFPDCTFSVSKSKQGTGRVVVWHEARVLHSFTLEASFFGVGVNKKPRHATQPLGSNQLPPSSSTSSPLELSVTHFMPHDLRGAGASLGLALVPFSHLLDRDRPAPTPMPMSVVTPTDEDAAGQRAFSAVHAVPSGLATLSRPLTAAGAGARSLEAVTVNAAAASLAAGRLAPLSFPTGGSSHAGSLSTPLLAPPSSSSSPASSPRLAPASPAASFGQFFGMGAMMLTSLPSTEDLLREIEDALPDDYARGADSDDEGESAGSESDPSGDNMEAEELQRQVSWKDLLQDASAARETQPPPPRLSKNRSQSLLKRFSDSMLRMQLLPDDVPPSDAKPTESTREHTPPTKSSTSAPAVEPARVKPAVALAPVKAPTAAAAYLVRRHPMALTSQHGAAHTRDRNKDIAALHLRAVQRRSRAKHTSHRIVIHEQERE